MKRIEAFKKAEKIANIVKKYSNLLREVVYEDGYHHNGKKMKVFEIILFGSTTRKCDDELVGDIDLLVIDNGVFSSRGCARISDNEDAYWTLSDNIQSFAEEICWHYDFVTEDEAKIISNLTFEEDVDFHVLPLEFFRNKKFRKETKTIHHDPNFFKNLFSTAMRWRMGKQFVPVDVSYFERKYKVRLQDLKK